MRPPANVTFTSSSVVAGSWASASRRCSVRYSSACAAAGSSVDMKSLVQHADGFVGDGQVVRLGEQQQREHAPQPEAPSPCGQVLPVHLTRCEHAERVIPMLRDVLCAYHRFDHDEVLGRDDADALATMVDEGGAG